MRRSISMLGVVCALAAVTLLAGAPAAFAHAQRQVGSIHMEIGFGTEPAYVGQPNSVQLILTSKGRPVVDLGDSLKVQVSFGGQQTQLPLEPNFEVGGDGIPGDYRAWFIPSSPVRIRSASPGASTARRSTSRSRPARRPSTRCKIPPRRPSRQ